jgi:hypothetical protein
MEGKEEHGKALKRIKSAENIEELDKLVQEFQNDEVLLTVITLRRQLLSFEREIPLEALAKPPASKKQRVGYDFGDKFEGFADYVNTSINNKSDLEIFERDKVEEEILLKIEPKQASSKPNCVTIWSGRGSGKTSLIRNIAMKSARFQAARDCGRLMIFDAKRDNVETIPDELTCAPESEITRFLIVLVAFHLCKIFGDTSVNGVEFTSNATIASLWESQDYLPSSLLEKLTKIKTGVAAYSWWKICTQGFVQGDDEVGPNPIIIIDTAETLAVAHKKKSPKKKTKEESAAEESAGATSLILQSSPTATASAETSTSTPHKHKDPEERYLVLEWIMMCIPNDHAIIVFGTGQRSDFLVPADVQTNLNYNRVPPLNALSEEATFRLFQLRGGNPAENVRFVRTAYAVSAGIPRMLVAAFETKELSGNALTSTSNEIWEQTALGFYGDASRLIRSGKLTVSCLAKAVLISAVCDVQLDCQPNSIPGEYVTWEYLRWNSIAFLGGADGGADGQKAYLRIPRLLWQEESKEIGEWVKQSCSFDLHDLLPTIKQLYEDAGDASATSSGRAWERCLPVHLWRGSSLSVGVKVEIQTKLTSAWTGYSHSTTKMTWRLSSK